MSSVFPYPGNKSRFAEWILSHFPDHDCYVEVFGGAAGVLANKPPSHNEVYNDIDGDLVQFFDVLRERGDELADWLTDLPYSREMHEKWSDRWYDKGWRPDDPVQRAGVFYYLRATSFGGKYRYPGGFATSIQRNQARTYDNGIDRLRSFADRFSEVVVEHLNWQACIDQYDAWGDGSEDDPRTLLYCDPPYYDTTLRYRHGQDFDHEAFASVLNGAESEWVVSYDTVPKPVQKVATTVVQQGVTSQMGIGYNDEPATRSETLLLSFDRDEVQPFVDAQANLAAFEGGDR